MSDKHDATRIQLKDLIALRQQAESFLLPNSDKKATLGSGSTYSPFKSRGLDFQEVRVYQPGDDIRQIDWHVTAKYGKPFTKLYTEEKERTIFFVVDLRSNMAFATHGDFKSVVAARLTAFMAFIAEHQKDKIGYLILTDDALLSSGDADTTGLSPLLNVLAHPNRKAKAGSWTDVIRLLNQFLPVGSFVFFFSDFYDWQKKEVEKLAPLSEKNTFVLCDIYDALESDLPADTLPFSNGTDTVVVSTQNDKLRQRFHADWQAHQASLEQASHKYGWGFIPLATNSDYLDLFARFCFGRSAHES